MKHLFFAFIIISTLIGCKTERKEIEKEKDPSQLSIYFNNSGLPAAIMGHVKKDGKMEWRAFGPSIWDGTDTINENNIFRIFSMTKSIASVGALQLVEKGLIGLDDPLNKLMPNMTSIPLLTNDGKLVKSDKVITLRHLLTNTAGFGYEFIDAQLQAFDKTDWDYEDLPRLFEPGEDWHYGTNLDWVGKIIEKISNQDLETYFRTNITGPLKMNNTWFNVPENLKNNIVSWGTRDSIGFQEYPRIPKDNVTTFSAGGGLFGSPKDYLTFLECIMNDGKYEGGQILKSETIEMMFKNQLPSDLTLNFGIPGEGLPDTMGQFLDEKDTHSLAWALENNEKEIIRPKGAAYWGGLANSYYTVDKGNGIAIVYFTQFLPFNDKVSYDFYRLFETEVYLDFAKK